MTIQDLINKFKDAKDGIDKAMSDTATSVSFAGKAYAERIILDEGFGAQYSNNKMKPSFFFGQELNQSGLNFLKSKKTTNWKELREAQGLQTAHVDLHYSNEMFRSMMPLETKKEGNKYVAPLGSTNQAGQHKMNMNFKRYGDFISKAMGEKGKEIIGEVAMEEQLRFLKLYGIL